MNELGFSGHHHAVVFLERRQAKQLQEHLCRMYMHINTTFPHSIVKTNSNSGYFTFTCKNFL